MPEEERKAITRIIKPPLISEEQRGGQYANWISVSASPWEITLDFAQVTTFYTPDGTEDQTRFVQRLIISPLNLRGFIDALNSVLNNYEKLLGTTLPNMREITQAKKE